MKILIIGSGAREHALAWKLKQSLKVTQIFVAKGNGGTAKEATNIDIAEDNIPDLVQFASQNKIDLVVVGPELPLTLGIVDAMQAVHIPCFGPNFYCAQLEASKAFAKEIMLSAKVPTAKHAEFTDFAEAKKYLSTQSLPIVIKADGLAAGKGVVIAQNQEEALNALKRMLEDKEFGKAGQKIVIEEFLIGEEVSLLAFCDAKTALPLPSAQDHKAIFDGDQGPNTGGMGAYSPTKILPDQDLNKMSKLCIEPILDEIKKRGQIFRGILYAGLMLTKDGPKVLEYNVRFGDPECQALLMRLDEDLCTLLFDCLNDKLSEHKSIQVKSDFCLTVVMSAEGYPSTYKKGMTINGIENAEQDGAKVFISGAKLENNQLISSGGRVLSVTALGKDVKTAQTNAYQALQKIKMSHSYYRKDIGFKAL